MTIDELLAAARSRIDRSAPSEVAAGLRDGTAIVVDLRCAASRQADGLIPGSISIPRSVLEWRCDPSSDSCDERVARPSERVILFCEQGYSSSLAAESLARLGFAAVGDLIGGFEAWVAEGHPVERL